MQSVTEILQTLAGTSQRPRFAFMLLGLMSELADQDGRVGPFVGQPSVPVRDWLARTLVPLTAHHRRRQALLDRMRCKLGQTLPPDPEQAQRILSARLEERAIVAVKSNISRAMTELEKAGFIDRYYAGYRTNHAHRGGRRTAVYTLKPETVAAFRRRTMLV